MSAVLPGADVRNALITRLRAEIALLPAHERLPTERELAARHDVSYSTVRRATSRLAAEGTLYKVPGRGTFVAERAAPESSTQRTLLYADAWQVSGNPYFIRCLEGVIDAADDCGYAVQICRCQTDADHPDYFQAVWQALQARPLDGILLPWALRPQVEAIRREFPDVRLVSMSGRHPVPGVPSLAVDHQSLGFYGCKHLLSSGAKTVRIVNVHECTWYGALSACREHEVSADLLRSTEVAAETPFDIPRITKQIQRQETDGILFDDDCVALECLRALREQAPDSLNQARIASLANAGSDLLPPDVTRLAIDAHELGRSAVWLLHRMFTEARAVSQVTLIQTRLEAPAEGAES